jgi:hypothetical protein
MKVIILIGQRVRSGTNFLGSTLSLHPEIQTLPQNRSHGEFNLFRSDSIIEFYNEATLKSFGLKFNEVDKLNFYFEFGQLWLKLLTEKYELDENKVLFIKTPIIKYHQLWLKTFPDAKFIFLTRDGRDNVISSVRASNIRKKNISSKKKMIKSLNHYSGRSFRAHILDWKATAITFDSIKKQKNINKVRYESLVNNFENIQNLLESLELDSSEKTIEKCINAPVVGSSFGLNTKKSASNWIPEKDKSKFVFSNKWEKWNFFKKFIFKALAGRLLVEMDYEKDNNW